MPFCPIVHNLSTYALIGVKLMLLSSNMSLFLKGFLMLENSESQGQEFFENAEREVSIQDILEGGEYPYSYLALEGGGAKGFLYIGVARMLERIGQLQYFDAVAGSSVGAIAALLFATGWNSDKIGERLMSLDLSKAIRGGIISKLMMPIRLERNYGMHKAKGLTRWLEDIVEEVTGNRLATYDDWHQLKETNPELGLKDIFTEACNYNTKLNEIFSYLSEHRDVPIARGIRASAGFPLVFTPVEIKGNLYGDGGIQKNCPSTAFDNDGVANKKTLSVRLDDIEEINYFDQGITPKPKKLNRAPKVFIAEISALHKGQNFWFNESDHKKETIFGDTLDAGTLDFKMSPEEVEALIASGEYAVIRFFIKKHPEYIQELVNKEMLDQKTVLRVEEGPIAFSEFVSGMKLKQREKHENAQNVKEEQPALKWLYQRWRALPAFEHYGEKQEHEMSSGIDLEASDPKKHKCAIM